MAEQAVRPSDAASGTSRWRTVDIVVTAVLGVAFGVVFWAWNLLWAAVGTTFTAFPPGQAFMYGVWLLPAVLAPLVVRKAGAGLFAELIAAIVSALLGAGLSLTELREEPIAPWRVVPQLAESDGVWSWPDREWLPLALAITAAKPR